MNNRNKMNKVNPYNPIGGNKAKQSKAVKLAKQSKAVKPKIDFRKLLLSGSNVDYMFFDEDYDLEIDLNETVIIVAANGVFEVVKTPIGLFNIKLANLNLPIPGLKKFNSTYLWSIPKPDISFLYDLMALNKAVFNKYSSEVFAPLVFNTVTRKYEIVVPEQVVSGAHVTYNKVTYPKNTIQVIDHHSHAGMGAFFSGTDDGDDKQVRFKISIVIGKNNTANPEVKARLTINGNFVDVNIDSLFSRSNSDITSLLKNITKEQHMHIPNHYGSHYGSHYGMNAVNTKDPKASKAPGKNAQQVMHYDDDDDLLDLMFDDEDLDHEIDLELDQWGIFEAVSDGEIREIISKYKKAKGLADDALDPFVIAASEFLN